MKFKVEIWTIQKLFDTYKNNGLNLNPPYQRNNIWTEKSQKILISSIKDGMPIPTFFLHGKGTNIYDVADGQQRCRAIFAYIKGEVTDNNNTIFRDDLEAAFLNYELPVVVIDKSVSQEKIREFYVMVNNTGMKLNKPELTKAKYFDSSILNLVEDLTDSPNFKALGIFQSKQSDRMIDREFVEELVALLHFGIGDKKNDVKKLYEATISSDIIDELKSKFSSILEVFITQNDRGQFSQSRYSQRNDFYTLFKFVANNPKISESEYCIFFEVLMKIQYDISPSNENSPELQYYAFNCVSQSNAKQSREARLKFFEELLLNDSGNINKVQKALLKYYRIKEVNVLKVGKYITLDPKLIESQFKK